jgi:hypothetical protein
MASDLSHHVEAYSGWRQRVGEAVGQLREWLRTEELCDTQSENRLENVTATLRDDKLSIAFVAEFSRGKSELINAIFFADYGSRILPSSAGRTTMCPTELLYEAGEPPALKLLPIETRKGGTTISEFRGFPEEWKVFSFDIGSPTAMIEILRKIVEVRVVPRDEAQAMGFHIASDETETGLRVNDQGLVEVPAWRHAIINLPHPLLKQGLVILDTPGLNALGAEPELTLSMLPSAHAVLFILAADAGVTKTDIGIWHDHIGSRKDDPNRGRLVVLNKIDGLWDGLRGWDEVDREIERQVADTASILNIPATNVYPVSAQKALLAKVKGDAVLLERSRIGRLEDALAGEILPAKREIVRDNIEGELGEVIRAVRLVLMQRLKGVYEHVEELSGLNNKNLDVIEHMMSKVKADKEVFEKSLQRFHATRSVFSKQTNALYSHLNMKNLDTLIAETKKNMEISLTTGGLREEMQRFFQQAQAAMEQAAAQTHEIREMMEGVYRRFQQDHGFANAKPAAFSVARYQREIKRLETKHEQFMKGLSLVLTEQRVLTRKFFESSVVKIRAVYKMAIRDADNWLRHVMTPMESQVREHQIQLRRRLESIKRIHQASDTIEERLRELEQVRDGFREQERKLDERVEAVRSLLRAEPTAGAAAA